MSYLCCRVREREGVRGRGREKVGGSEGEEGKRKGREYGGVERERG